MKQGCVAGVQLQRWFTHVLAYNFKRAIAVLGTPTLIKAIKA